MRMLAWVVVLAAVPRIANGAPPESATRSHAQKAADLVKRGDVSAALVEYEAERATHPGAASDYQLGRCLDHLGRVDEAVASYQRALAVSGGLSARDSAEAKKRIAALKKSVASDSDREALTLLALERGSAHFEKGEYALAHEQFEAARSLMPGKANAYRWLGLTEEKLDRCPEALRNFDVFLDRVPEGDERVDAVEKSRASCRKSIAAAQRAGDKDPELEIRLKAQIERGAELFSKGKFKEARGAFEAALDLAPERATPYRWIGLVDEKLGNCPAAVQSLDVFLARVAPDDQRVPEVQEARQRCQGKPNAPVATAPATPKAPVAPSPSDPEARAKSAIDRGTQFYDIGDFEEAREQFEEARKLLPDRATPYRWLGLTDAKLGHCKDAMSELQVFLSRVPKNDARVAEAEATKSGCAAMLQR